MGLQLDSSKQLALGPEAPVLTGGCQCGAVRYRVVGPVLDPHICHCRMCQRAVGGPFAALFGAPPPDVEWTHGAPKLFASSTVADRGFCEGCGTPLTFQYRDGTILNLTIATLDDPGAVVPLRQYGLEGRLDFVCSLADLPGTRTEEDVSAEDLARMQSHQYKPQP